MFEPEPTHSWRPAHQYLHSLLWSSFLDLDFYTADRAYRRFRPYSFELVVQELFRHRPNVAALGTRKKSPLEDPPGVRLQDPFLKLALWTLAPRFFDDATDESQRSSPTRARRARADSSEDSNALRKAFRQEFERLICVQMAGFRQDTDDRSLLPPLPELGIGDTRIAVVAGRRSATARATSIVQLPYEQLFEIVHPATWDSCPYWQPASDVLGPSEVQRNGYYDRCMELSIRLPGGSHNDKVKTRELAIDFAITKGPFAARVDYEGRELGTAGRENVRKQWRRDAKSEARLDDKSVKVGKPDPLPDYSPFAVHVKKLRGYLAVEKVAGRPGWTSYVAERTVRFESPNHDRFRVETLMYWLAVELISFVEKRRLSVRNPPRAG